MLNGKRVLLVEDEAVVSMLLEEFLEDMGCQLAGTSARLDDALQKAAALALDVAVLDVNLAGELSYPVARVLRQRNIPFIFATGYGIDGLSTDLKDAPVLSKPFLHRQLKAALTAALRPLAP